MKISASAALALLGAAAQATTVPHSGTNDLGKFQELSLGAPQDVLAGEYINMWYRLTIDQFQAPHAAFSEDAWVAYGARTCLAVSNDLCTSFHTYLKNHTGAVHGTDLSWWAVDVYMNTAKADDYYHSNDTSVSHSRVFNAKSA